MNIFNAVDWKIDYWEGEKVVCDYDINWRVKIVSNDALNRAEIDEKIVQAEKCS